MIKSPAGWLYNGNFINKRYSGVLFYPIEPTQLKKLHDHIGLRVRRNLFIFVPRLLLRASHFHLPSFMALVLLDNFLCRITFYRPLAQNIQSRRDEIFSHQQNSVADTHTSSGNCSLTSMNSAVLNTNFTKCYSDGVSTTI